MKVLFIGGTGTISSACAQRCVDQGMDLYLLNRGKTDRQIPDAATVLTADYYDMEQAQNVLEGKQFDIIVNFIAFTPDHIKHDLELLQDKTDQYIFISSASAYQTPPRKQPVTEDTPLENPFWKYSREKIACEEELMRAHREDDFPVTIVRPSHTYDARMIPFPGEALLFHRAQQGKKVVIHGDGTALWTLTHNTDFAKGFVGLFGKHEAIGEAFHITSDEYLPWNQIAEILLDKMGLEADFIHLPSDFIAKFNGEYAAGLLGDKTHSMIFDNSKLRKLVPDFEATVPFSKGAEEIAEYYRGEDLSSHIDQELDTKMDRMIAAFEKAMK